VVDGAPPDRPGRRGEDLACDHLRRRGFVILARNYRCRRGELDLVARDGDVVVFVEVKERRGSSHGTAVEAVTAGKRRRIVSAARVWATLHSLSEAPVRFDVVSIDWGPEGPRVRHDAGAFGER
jgi:putative endonuclease